MPECFVIMPFGAMGSPDRERYNTVYEHIIRRPVTLAGFDCVRADEIPDFGPIPANIKVKLSSSDLVVADLSGSNPNVFYELGFRHAKGKHCISIADSDSVQRLPFDISSYRTVAYDTRNLSLSLECSGRIEEYARKIFKEITEPADPMCDEAPGTAVETPHRLESTVSLSLANISGSLSELLSMTSVWSEPASKLSELSKQVERLERQLQGVGSQFRQLQDAPRIVYDTVEAGLVGIYPSRPDAIEQRMYRHLQDEEVGISIVGSTCLRPVKWCVKVSRVLRGFSPAS